MDHPPPGPAPASPPRRVLTLLFSDLSDSTVLAGSGEPEDYLEILKYLRSHCLRVIPEHGGTIIDFSGDGFLAMFGYPDSTEGDGRRAVEAALTMHEIMRRSPFRIRSRADASLALHSGIHSGRVLVIENDLFPGRYTVVGEAPNLAAKLSDVAGKDEILVSAATLGGESHFFELRERGLVVLAGKSEPIATVQVAGLSPVHTRYEARARRGLTPFVGRCEAHATLQRHLVAARSGAVRIVYVVGAPGLGKTRAIQEFLRSPEAADCLVLQGYCESTQTAEPLHPFLQMLRALPVAGLGPELRGLSSARAFQTLAAFFAEQAARQPVILFIDDWHWVDDATRQLLGLLRLSNGTRLMAVIASRAVLPVDPGAQEGQILDLIPLTDEEVAQTIRRLRPDLDPFVVRHVQQLSGGNPLFVEELCHFASPGDLAGLSNTSDAGVAWLGAVIESRVSRLPAAEAKLVRIAAVIGKVIPKWLLEPLSGSPEDEGQIQALAERDLVFPGDLAGTLRFKHGITRDVVYNSVGRRERGELHLKIGNLLESHAEPGSPDDMVEALAYHYHAGGDGVRASRYAELAGDKALGAAALDRARGHYRVALDHLAASSAQSDARRYCAVSQRMGLACVWDPTRQHLDVFARALDIARELGDEGAMARAEYWLGYIHYGLGELAEAIEHCGAALALCTRVIAAIPEDDSRARLDLEAFRVQVLATLGQSRVASGEREGVLGQLDAAVDITRRHRSGARPAVGFAYTLACRGGLLADLGRFDEAHACFAEALEVAAGRRNPVEASVLAWKSAVHLWRGQWTEAIECSARVQTIAERIESLYVLSMAEAITGYARWVLNRDADAIDMMIRATSWLEARDKRLFISMNYGWIADAMTSAGRYPAARLYAAGALRRARRRDPYGAAMTYRALARLAELGQARGTPAAYLDLALRSADRRGSPHEAAVTWMHMAAFDARQGHHARGRAHLERATLAFRTMGMTWHAREAQRQLAAV